MYTRPMNPPPRANGSPRLGKIDRWLVNYLTFCTAMFVVSYILAYIWNYDNMFRITSMVLAATVLLKALMVPSPRNGMSGRASVMMALFCAVALFNSLVSLIPVETSLRWILWLGIVFCFYRVAGNADGSWTRAVINRLPFFFAVLYATIIVVIKFVTNDDVIRLAYHLSGLYGNLILASGLFATQFWQRITWSAFGLIAIFFSGAGGALFTIPIMFVPYILYSASSVPVKGIAVAMLITVGGSIFFESQLFGRFLDIKLNISAADSGTSSGMERLERSKDMRLALAQYGLALAWSTPLGTGLGHTYKDEVSRLYLVPHVHNGTISTLIELGFPGFFVVASLMIWMLWTILRDNAIETQLKGFYFTYCFTIFGRSLSENYAPFDLGNFFIFVFLLFSIRFFLTKQHQVEQNRRPAYPPPPRMMMRPFAARPPMPRPLQVR